MQSLGKFHKFAVVLNGAPTVCQAWNEVFSVVGEHMVFCVNLETFESKSRPVDKEPLALLRVTWLNSHQNSKR